MSKFGWIARNKWLVLTADCGLRTIKEAIKQSAHPSSKLYEVYKDYQSLQEAHQGRKSSPKFVDVAAEGSNLPGFLTRTYIHLYV